MKILLMPNFEGWAFDRIAQGIKKYGSHEYEIKYEANYRGFRGKDLPKEELDWSVYDRIVLFAPWMDWSNLPLDKTICIFHEAFEMDGYNTAKYYKAFVTSDISLEHIKHKENVLKVQTGIDSDDFFIEHPKEENSKPVVGWVGAYSGHREKKGFEEFYFPLQESFHLLPHLKELNYVETRNYPPFIRTYYSTIDVLVCTSSFEGYPLSILEATACGVPVVSTRVGIAPEVIPQDQIVERSVEALTERIGAGNLKVGNIDGWEWNTKIKEWEDGFL